MLSEKPMIEDKPVTPLQMVFVDLCTNGCVPITLAETMTRLYQASLKQEVTFFQKEALIGTIFYEVLKQEKVPRTLKEVSALTGIKIKAMMTILKKMFPQSGDLRPQEIVHRFCGKLGLMGVHAMRIERAVSDRRGQDATSPDTVCASIIYQYVKAQEIAIKTKSICDVCGVSRVSINRFLRRQHARPKTSRSETIPSQTLE